MWNELQSIIENFKPEKKIGWTTILFTIYYLLFCLLFTILFTIYYFVYYLLFVSLFDKIFGKHELNIAKFSSRAITAAIFIWTNNTILKGKKDFWR